MSKRLSIPPVWLVKMHEMKDADGYVRGVAKDYKLFGILVARKVSLLEENDAKYWKMP